MSDLQGRVAALKAESVKRQAANRAAMPGTAAIVDDLRRHLGPMAIGWARFEEGGRVVEWGTKTMTGTAYPSVVAPKGRG